MKQIPLVRRKSLINAGIKNSQLIDLAQKNEYFKNRAGDKAFFMPADALLAFVASELANVLPFRHIDAVVNDLAKNHRNLHGLLKQNSDQYLIVEKGPSYGELVVFPILVESLKVWDWQNRQCLLMINLGMIYSRIKNLFEKDSIQISHED
jgi:hypothetical protein